MPAIIIYSTYNQSHSHLTTTRCPKSTAEGFLHHHRRSQRLTRYPRLQVLLFPTGTHWHVPRQAYLDQAYPCTDRSPPLKFLLATPPFFFFPFRLRLRAETHNNTSSAGPLSLYKQRPCLCPVFFPAFSHAHTYLALNTFIQ